MAVSGSYTVAKLENLLLGNAPTSSSSSSVTRASFLHVSQGGFLKRRGLVQRTGVRCDAAESDKPKVIDLAAASLQFKANAADRYNREKSSIVVIGLSIHTTPVEMREKLAIPEAEWPHAIQELCSLNHIEEAAVLSTCNRMEIYVVALSQHRGVKEVTEWMSKKSGIPTSELCQHRFLLYNKDATQHLFEVASGLDSLVLGEGQILAQVKQVVKVGQAVNGFGRKISALFKGAITAGKRVRTDTNIASGAVSVSSAAVELALMKIPSASHSTARILVVGAGKMGRLVIKHLVAKGCTKMVVVNRSEERVEAIREELQGIEIIYKPLTEMMNSAAEADVIFTSTASETPLFFKEHTETLPPVGTATGGVRLFVDISVPRNVGSCVSEAGGTRVYNVDDLKEVVAANKEDRLRKAREAQVIIAEETKQFEAWNDSLETVPTIKKLRTYAEGIRSQELDKCFARMGEELSKKSRKAIDDLSRGIINKLLHGPMQHLRCDESEGRSLSETLETMHALNRMYDLESDISMIENKIRAKIIEQTSQNMFHHQKNPKVIDFAAAPRLRFKAINAANRYNRESSSIVAIGLNIHTTPIEMLKKIAIKEAEWPRAITELCSLNHIEEAAVLSTCNRMEIHVVALSRRHGVKEVTEWISKKSGIPFSELCQHRILLYEKDATQHLFEVASGLDSLALGEGHILDQVEQVVKVGQGLNRFGRKTSALIKGAITTGKRVRTDTNIPSGAHEIIAEETEKFEAWKDSLETVPTIKKLRMYVERIRSEKVKKCFSILRDELTEELREAIDHISHKIIEGYLHRPMEHLRCEGRCMRERIKSTHTLNRMYNLESDYSAIETKIRKMLTLH